MEHHPYIALNDGTEITYSDIKTRKNGVQYVTIYFETPVPTGFHSMDIEYPNGTPQNIIGYTDKKVQEYMHHYNKIGDLVFQFAKEDS